MSAPAFFTSLSMMFGTLITIAAIIAYAIAHRARAAQGQADAYQRLAERAISAETASAAVLTTMQHDLSDLRARMAAVETVLKDVG